MTFLATSPVMQITDDVHDFIFHIFQSFLVLGIGLSLAVVVQVRVALKPLKAIRSAISDVQAGRLQRLPQDFPSDVQPLVYELNFLLDHNELLLKRAKNQVVVQCVTEQDRLVLAVEDDGPGIAEEDMEDVTQRGRKLDDSYAGHGHGRGIVKDIANLYDGTLKLSRSPLGGLQAELDLPAA